ncbi:hypothetical protein LINGRAHAP2_LOCUS37064 [Linum grandiflorum]
MKLEGKQVSPKSGNETLVRDIVKENNQKGLLLREAKVDYVDQFLYQTNDQAAKVDSKPLPNEEITEMPEVTICYEEDESSHAVKDICVDEGVPVHDKFLFDTTTMDDYLSTFLPPGKAIKNHQEEDKEPVLDDVIPENPAEGSEDAEKKIHSVEIKEEEVHDAPSSNALKRSQSLGDLLALPEPSAESTCLEPLSSQTSGSIRRHMPDDTLDLSATSTSHEERENEPNSIASTSKAATAQESDQEVERHSMDSMSDDLTNEVAGRLSFENRAAASDIKLPPPNHEPNFHAKPQLLTSSIAGTDSNRIRYNVGDSSFSGVATEPVPFSGSISMRSDSSTTSARSFAFPVLQSEWNSSPVRMAKADRRRLSKHRRWRSGILCCKF